MLLGWSERGNLELKCCHQAGRCIGAFLNITKGQFCKSWRIIKLDFIKVDFSFCDHPYSLFSSVYPDFSKFVSRIFPNLKVCSFPLILHSNNNYKKISSCRVADKNILSNTKPSTCLHTSLSKSYYRAYHVLHFVKLGTFILFF